MVLALLFGANMATALEPIPKESGFSGIPAKAWKDPYLVNQDRIDTKRKSNGGRLTWGRIFGKAILAKASQKDFGTIVIGRSGMNRSFFMGSVSRYVINRAMNRALWVIS